ncbi:MAG TPA: type VI secretion system contractile sheath large subunit [Thermoanaerobaculia bacterium]|nr:type VI secretion system contractile sheath large subunit [Thermoanaerobaculia bacterium]
MPTFAHPDRAEAFLVSSREEEEPRIDPEERRRLLVIGDFSDRASRLVREPLGPERRPIAVDIDNLDALFARLSVEIRLASAEGTGPLFRPRSLDDLHPDRLLLREPAFHDLRRIRQGLEDPERFDEAAAAVRAWSAQQTAARREPPPGTPSDGPEAPGLLEEILATSGATPSPKSKSGDFEAFVEQIVTPHLERAGGGEKERLIIRADQEIGARMRRVLHDPAFQGIEAAWRGLVFLLRHVETGEDLRVEILDATKEELALDAKGASELSDSGLYRILVGSVRDTPGASPWSAVAGLYEFGPTVEDVALLARVGKVAAAANAPFLSAAAPSLLACDSFASAPDPRRWLKSQGEPVEELWAALRHLPEARYLGLAAPRFLLRLPYGGRTDPAEHFAFEEFEGTPDHDSYLWGNPALLCLALLESPGTLTGLPLHVYEDDGESRLQPCAETSLPLSVAEAMLERGVMAVMALPDRDVVRMARLQSVADPPSRLGTFEG